MIGVWENLEYRKSCPRVSLERWVLRNGKRLPRGYRVTWEESGKHYFSCIIPRIRSILFFKYKKMYFILSNMLVIIFQLLTINNHFYASATFLLKSSKHFTFVISLIPKTVPVGKVISILTFKCLSLRISQAYINYTSKNVNVHQFCFTVPLALMCITHLFNSLNVLIIVNLVWKTRN